MTVPPSRNLISWFDAFTDTIKDAKITAVRRDGFGTDVLPTITLGNSKTRKVAIAALTTPQHRAMVITPDGDSRWSNLARQAVAVSGADVFMHALEYFHFIPDVEQPIEVIEILAMDAKTTMWMIAPYRYEAGKGVIWDPPLPVGARPIAEREALAARSAWVGTTVYRGAIKYLTDTCDVSWSGSVDLLAAMGLPNQTPTN